MPPPIVLHPPSEKLEPFATELRAEFRDVVVLVHALDRQLRPNPTLWERIASEDQF